MPTTKTLIFTDLDGTLLDHDTYSWAAAAPALARATELGVPVIPCTSKTLPECLEIEASLGLQGPIIFENGSGVALPKQTFPQPPNRKCEETETHWIFAFGMGYGSLRQILLSIRDSRRYHFRGFGDMRLAEIMEATGLGEKAAALAQQRRHSEPLLWLDNARNFDRFRDDANARGLTLTRGGRFIHVMESSNKGKAMLWLATLYEFLWGAGPFIIALGDSNNDLPMLAEADIAVVIRNAHKSALNVSASAGQRVFVTEETGPVGWNQAVLDLLKTEKRHG